MTIEELDALYARASRLIMSRSAAAAGKALVLSSSSLDEAAKEIAEIYGLTDQEVESLSLGSGGTTLATVQKTASDLLGTGARVDAVRAVSIARAAIDGGRKLKVAAALLKAGPVAAEAAAAGGQVASRATVWGWVATAAYAAGTGSWFAYNLRAFNLAAYEARRIREGIEQPPEGAPIRDAAAAGLATVADAASSGAKAVGLGAEAAVRNAARGGGWLAGAAGGLFRRTSGPDAGGPPASEPPEQTG